MKRWERILSIRDGEKRLALMTCALFALVQSTHALSSNAADALFFLRFGVEELPSMIVISGVAVMVALLLHSAGLGRFSAETWLPLIAIVSGLLALGEWGLSFSDNPAVYPVIWVGTQVLFVVTFTALWNSAGAVTTTRQAKRLYPVFASAGVAGAIVGNLLTGPLANWIGTENLLALQGLILLGSWFIFRSLARLFIPDDSPGGSIIQESLAALRTTRSIRLLRLIAIFVFTISALLYMIIFPFNEVVTATFDSEAEIAGFLGLFASIATGLTFVVSLFLANKLFARFGIAVSLLVVPMVYVLGFALWLTSFTLATASVVRAAQWVVSYAIGGTATTAMYNVLSGRRRGQVMSFISAVPAQLGIIVGGVVLLATTKSDDQYTFIIGLVLSLAATWVVIRMKPAYSEAVVDAIKKGLVGVFRVPHEGVSSPFGRESVDALVEYLTRPTPEERRMGLLGLAEAGDTSHTTAVEPLLRDPDPSVRIAALDSMCANAPQRTLEIVSRALNDDSPEVRAHAVNLAQPEQVEPLLDDPDPVVRSISAFRVGGSRGQSEIDALLNGGDRASVLAVLAGEIQATDVQVDSTPFITHSDPNIRAAAIRRFRGPTTELLPGLDDESIKVRRLAAEALATTEEGRESLQGVLVTGSVSATDAALRNLVPVDRFTDDLLNWAQREASRARLLNDYKNALVSDGQSVTYLQIVLGQRIERLEEWIVLAMTTTETADVMRTVRMGLESENPETKAQAVEALDIQVPHVIAKPLVDLLEAPTAASSLSEEEALTAMSRDFDPWISSIASRAAVADSSGVPQDRSEPMHLLDRVVALQRVPMFAGLDPEDLDLIAQTTEETSFVSGEQIFRQGEDATQMLVIIDGEAIVTTGDDGAKRELARRGPGQHIGELGLLHGSTRTADVHAGDAGVFALTISDTDLTSILQERPEVAVAMLDTLASRLAERN